MPLSPFGQIKWFGPLQPLLIGHVLKAPGHLHSPLLHRLCLLHIPLEVGGKKKKWMQ